MCSPFDCCCSACLSGCLPNFVPCCCPSYCYGKCLKMACSHIHLQFIKSVSGVIKICETIIAGLILWLLINYGLHYNSTIGLAFEGSLTATSTCFLTSALLLVCYITSEKAFRTIRFTHFEIMLNFVACLLHLSSAYFLVTAIKAILRVMQINFEVHHAMTIAYILNVTVGFIHAVDVCICYRYYKTGR